MIEVKVKFLGGMREEMGASQTTLSLPSGATRKDLEDKLRAIGIDPESENTIITLNGHGLNQWHADTVIHADDDIAVFPLISGG